MRKSSINILRPAFLALLWLLLPHPAYSQPPQLIWSYAYGTGTANSAVQATDGGFASVGTATGDSLEFVRTTDQGQLISRRIYGKGLAHALDNVGSGGYVIAGLYQPDAFSSYARLIRTNDIGDTIWTRNLVAGSAADVKQTTDGGFVVTGGSGGLILAKTDSSGIVSWIRFFGSELGLTSFGNSVEQTNDGGFIVAGFGSVGNPTRAKAWIIRTDQHGDTLWTRLIGDNDVPRDEAYSIVCTPDGAFAFCGYQGFDPWIVRLDASGDTLWTRKYLDANFETIRDLTPISSGFAFTGQRAHDLGLAAIDDSGNLLWADSHGTPATDWGVSIQSTSQGYIIAGGGNCQAVESGCYPPYYTLTSLNTSVSSVPIAAPPEFRAMASPNPFTNKLTIHIQTNQPRAFRVSIVSLNGRLVAQPKAGWLDQVASIEWETPQWLTSGIYYCIISSGESRRVIKCLKR